jgi:hypothetical protein
MSQFLRELIHSTFSKSLIQRYFSGSAVCGGGSKSLVPSPNDRVPGRRVCLHFNGFSLIVENVFLYFQQLRAKKDAKWRFCRSNVTSTFSS